MTSIYQLKDQKRTVLKGMANSKNGISDLEDKISKLKKASNQLTKISELETIKSSIDSLTIESGRWNGEEKKTFKEAYDEYKEKVKKYVTATEDAKEAIDEDIKRHEDNLDTKVIGLDNLESVLDLLDDQISQAEKESVR